jgi:ketosteroid isomerase-like protein
MAGENVELVRRAFDRWNSGDREIRPDEVDDEVELHSVLLGGVVRGPDGFRRWFLEIDQQFVEWRSEIAELREVDRDRLLALGTIHLRGRESEVEFDQPMAWLIDFRDGKVIRLEMFPTHSQGLEAAGLSA